MTTGDATNPWLERRVFHWAHQGGAKEAPSNTLHAMNRVAAIGADGLEFDVHRSADERVVLIHDKTLERTTNGSGLVSEHSAGELAALDAAYWWVRGEVDNHDPATPASAYESRGQTDKDLGVPVLDDLLERFGHLPMTIEVNDENAAEPLVAILRAQKRGPYVAPQVPDRLVIGELKQIPASIRRLLPEWLRLKVTSRRPMRRAHRVGLAVHAWTIGDADKMRALMASRAS